MNVTPARAVNREVTIEKSRRSVRKVVFATLYLVSFALLIWFFADGFSYYTTPYAQRPHHPEYRVFRPTGSEGLLFGIVGASMMVLMLIYSVRKRTRWLGRKLSLRDLLDFHIYLGIIGPLFIVLHTSFKVQGLVAVSFWSMVAVALSGYFGRYLYLQIPRGIEGNELSLKDLEQSTKALTEDLKVRFRLNDDDVARVDGLFLNYMTVHHTGFEALLELMTDDMFRWFMKLRAKRRLARILPLPRRQFNELFEVSFRRALLNRRIVMLGHVQQFFHYWHVVHKPFAIIMYIVMCVHIGVAVWTGYAWIH